MKETLGEFIHSKIIENKLYEQELFNKVVNRL
jgi:hypothetical protein